MIGNSIYKCIGYGIAAGAFFAGSASAPGGPVSVAIEPCNVCNLACPLCAAGAGLMTRPRGCMTLRSFTTILEKLPSSVSDLYLWGQGEPFMAPDFLAMVRRASNRGIRTIVSTNGHFLENPADIIGSGLSRLIVSLDGIDDISYQSYRRGGSFGQVVEGVRNLATEKHRTDKGPIIELQCLVTHQTEHDLDKYRFFAFKIGADRVVFKTLQAASFVDGGSFLPEQPNLTRYRVCDGGAIIPVRRGFMGERCFRIYHSAQIDWQGNVLPCCFDKNSSHVMGNILAMSWKDIWNSAAYQTFRTLLASKGRILPMCSDCTEGLSRMNIHA